jgi:geranylgeranyl diphosphate synthase type II
MDLEAYLEEKKNRVDAYLEQAVPSENTYPQILHKAMRYSLFAGGKRIRPILVISAFETLGGTSDVILSFASALELIHTYSLIHDDLPAMDNDDFRRGKPTNHKVFGEAMAILAGDALLTLAFSLMTEKKPLQEADPRLVLLASREVSFGAGNYGMIGGQVVDILSEGTPVDHGTLEYIHTHKTGALIRAALRVGGILGKATQEELLGLTRYGECVGLAFQIADDLLDIEGTKEELGKNTQGDAPRGKITYPAVFGREASRQRAQELVDMALKNLESFGERAMPLRELAHFIIRRRR